MFTQLALFVNFFLGPGYLFTVFCGVLVNQQIFKDLRSTLTLACCIVIRCGFMAVVAYVQGGKAGGGRGGGAGILFPDNGRGSTRH